MNPTTSTLKSLENWVTENRQFSRKIDYQADSLLVNMLRMRSRARRIAALEHQPLTLGCYGYAQAGKNSLLAALQYQSNQRIEIVLGDQSLDYLTHINPGHVPPAIAVRFSQTSSVDLPQYPLRLALFSECELVYQFMMRYQQSAAPRVLAPSQVTQRLADLAKRRLPGSVNPRYEEDVAQLLLDYRRLQRRGSQCNDTLELRISELAPKLSLNDRAALFSLFWGEDSVLTQEWLRLAQYLEQLGHPEQVLAPASLVVDSFMLPVEGFLTPANPHDAYLQDDVQVCSIINGVSLPPLSLPQQDLALICAEVILTQKPGTTLSHIDLLDIPLHQLAFYTQRLQPDILLICNAVSRVAETQAVGKALSRWVDKTQISGHGHLPGLIWAITAADSRFKSGVNLDENVQRRVGTARTRWGTLQAQDNRNVHLLRDWLQAALTPERKTQRLAGLHADLGKQIQSLFGGLAEARPLTPQQERHQAEVLVRTLQTHALQLGALLACLVPSREELNQCWLQNQQQISMKTDYQELNIDLFAEESLSEAVDQEDLSYAKAIHRLWINHLYAPLQQAEASPVSVLGSEQWLRLCEILISTSYRLDLPGLLESVSTESNQELAVARCHTVLGDFVAWLGYAGTPYHQRPLSRINPSQAIFAPASTVDINQRLSKLGEQPQRTNASYAYDWLVALYTRATENNSDDQTHNKISGSHRQSLLKLLT